jgi:L-ascorbate metabolism protein UlaG (beta-lactamase superfamily)
MFEIEYKGGNGVVIAGKKATLMFDPKLSLVGLKDIKTKDAVVVATETRFVSGADDAKVLLDGPGEYEVKGVYIKGFKSNSTYDKEPRLNTIYMVSLEGMNLCFLGALSDKDISNEALEALDEVDILFTPIGGNGVLTPADAYKLAVKLEPKIIIPMHYGSIGDANALKVFLKEGGEDALKPEDKLTLKKKDLEGRKTDIVVLGEQA